ncbi:MAG: sigma factor-like helix-turn-helix DNA-binding protein [Myxococcota bacterium]
MRVEGLVPQLLGPLRERERDVLAKRYGLDGEPLTLRQAGSALGISRERARQIQNRAMEKLREGTSIALIDNWVDAHLSDHLRRTLIAIGGLATTQAIDDASRANGLSLSLVAQVLERDVSWLLERGKLTTVGEDLWAVNPPFAELCRTVTRLYLDMTRGNESGLSPTQAQIDAIRAAFPTAPAAGSTKRPFPPNEKFIRLVLEHHNDIILSP